MPLRDELPFFTLTDEQLPELKDWEVGGEYMLMVTVEQKSLEKGRQYEFDEEKERGLRARFKVKGIKAVESKKMSKEEFAGLQVEARSSKF